MSEQKRNALNWFEIPSTDFNRATKFYESIFGFTMHRMDMGGGEMSFFPADDGKVGGAVIKHQDAKPSDAGTMVYLNAHPDLTPVLERVESSGGKIVMPKTQVNEEIGYVAVFLDTEGNRVALHSQN